MLFWIVCFLTLNIVRGLESNLLLPAFCTKPANGVFPNHPQKFPEPHIPWVWEAVYDPVLHKVDISFIIPAACHFNQTRWLEVSNLFPQYGKYFSYGDRANLLVDAQPDFDEVFVMGLENKPMNCLLYRDGVEVDRVLSIPFATRRPFLGPMMVRCPVQGAKPFDSVQLEVSMGSILEQFDRTTNRTEIFPVCIVPSYQPEHKKYNMSIVTATSRGDVAKTIEWIEYHRLVGVDHFFIYNTAQTEDQQKKLSSVLSYYAQRGVVTEVIWPYKNCLTHGMAKGRYVWYTSPSSGKFEYFRPPCPIAAYGAHASAYSRFRHTSKYIIYADDDEFLSLTNHLRPHEYSLQVVADTIFRRHPIAPSIAFVPLNMNECPDKDKELAKVQAERNNGVVVPQQQDYPFPRLVAHHYARIGRSHEYKQIFRTDKVALFAVHYLSLLESSLNENVVSGNEPFFIRAEHGVTQHYITPAYISGDPFSEVDPLPIVNRTQPEDCPDSVNLHTSVGSRAIGPEVGKLRNHVMPEWLFEKLKINYRQTLKEIVP